MDRDRIILAPFQVVEYKLEHRLIERQNKVDLSLFHADEPDRQGNLSRSQQSTVEHLKW